MILPSIEDLTRYTAPPEPKKEKWEEPEDHCDYIDTFADEPNETEPTTDTP